MTNWTVDFDDYTWLMVVGCLIAFGAAMGIGANDAANSFATSVGSKTLKLWHAIIICAIFEFCGAVFMGSHVSDTVRKGITSYKHFQDDPEIMMLGMFCVLIAIAFWLAAATYLELPVSTTHSAIGGVVGMTIVAKGWDAVIWSKVWSVVASWFISPALSALIAIVLWVFIRFALLQVYPCCRKGAEEEPQGRIGTTKHKPTCATCSPYVRTLAFYPLVVGLTFGIQTFYVIYKGSPQLKLKKTPAWLAIVVSLSVGIVTGIVGIVTIPALMVLAEWRFARQKMEREDAAAAALEDGTATEMTAVMVGDDATAVQTFNEEDGGAAEKLLVLNGGGSPETMPKNEEPPTKESPEDSTKDTEIVNTVDQVDEGDENAPLENGDIEAEGEETADDVTEAENTGDIKEQFADKPFLGEVVGIVDCVDSFQSNSEVAVHNASVKVKNFTENILVNKLKMSKKTVDVFLPADNEFDIHGVGTESALVKRIHGNLERFDEKAEVTFSFLQIISACIDAFGHGANDVANAIAPLAAMYGVYESGEISKKTDVPIWILALGGFGIVVGLALFGHKIIRAIGVKLVAITPSRGFTVELGSATVVILASRLGWPVSTTHCQVGAEVGIGITDGLWPRLVAEDVEDDEKKAAFDTTFQLFGKKRKCWMCFAINWIQLIGVLFGWVITVFVAAVTAGLSFYILYHTPGKISCKPVNGSFCP